MGNPSSALTGAVCISLEHLDTRYLTLTDSDKVGAIYIAGEAVGAISQILVADKLGRLRFMQLAAVIVTIGAILQTASVNIGMFLAGRIISGVAVGYA